MSDKVAGRSLTPQEVEDARVYHRQRKARRAEEREAARREWLARVRSAVTEIAPQHSGVRKVCLYGSLVQEGRFRSDSDIDLAVECTDLPTESAFWRDLESRLQRDVDIRPLAEPILSEVERYGEVLYERKGDHSHR